MTHQKDAKGKFIYIIHVTSAAFNLPPNKYNSKTIPETWLLEFQAHEQCSWCKNKTAEFINISKDNLEATIK